MRGIKSFLKCREPCHAPHDGGTWTTIIFTGEFLNQSELIRFLNHSAWSARYASKSDIP